MPAVKMLCNRAILLNGGRLIMDASAHDVVSAYMNTDAGGTAAPEGADHHNAPGGGGGRRLEGRYTSTVWIPGNLLTDGTIYVSCALLSRTANTAQFYEKQVIAFMVSDNMGKETARGDWAGWMGGVIRPRLEWETKKGG